MCVLTAASVIVGIIIGEEYGKKIGYEMGYHQGLEKGSKKISLEIEDFPKTEDGKFYSTRAAMRNMSIKDDEE